MKTVNALRGLVAGETRPEVVVACGVFDGLHRGHQSIIDALAEASVRHQARSVVLTFDPHPRAVLGDLHAPPPLRIGLQHAGGTRPVKAAEGIVLSRWEALQ